MTQPRPTGHDIPVPREQLYGLLEKDQRLATGDHEKFKRFCVLLQSLYHHEFHATLEDMKSAYRLFNPDVDDALPLDVAPDEMERVLLERIHHVMVKGNFQEITSEGLQEALAGEGLFPISLDVPFDDFAFYKLYFQGESTATEEVKSAIPFMTRTVTFAVYDRVVLLVKFREAEHFANQKGKMPGRPGKIYLKYLKGVPKPDLEMVFPNPRPRMKLIHKLKIGVPVVAGLGITVHKLIIAPFVLGSAGNPISEGLSLGLVATLAGLGGYVFKAYTNYRNTVQDFLAQVTTSLYFKNMVSNQGVFNTLVDDAEEEETKEAVLAYYFLLASPEPMAGDELDRNVEAWLEERLGRPVDFELDDALGKLERHELLTKDDDGRYRVVDLDTALERVDRIWDNLFQYNSG
jgi:Protein of unknown function (DUF3754)